MATAITSRDQVPRTADERKIWFYFMAIRGSCALVALVAAINISLVHSILVVIGLLVVLTGVDGAYKSSLYWLRVRQQMIARRQREFEAEQRRLEKERLFEIAKRAASEKYFDERLLTLGKRSAPDEGGDPESA